LELTTKPITNPTAVLQENSDGWGVLVNMDTAASVALNPTGVVVWKLIDGKRGVAEIIAKVTRQFKHVPDTAAADIEALLSTLAEEGLIGYECTRP
jgi:hypothetical protein